MEKKKEKNNDFLKKFAVDFMYYFDSCRFVKETDIYEIMTHNLIFKAEKLASSGITTRNDCAKWEELTCSSNFKKSFKKIIW